MKFSNVKMSHCPRLSLALKDIDLKIKGEHFDIICQTGTGKSSIMATLFGMAGSESWTITIGGDDTPMVPLQKLIQSIKYVLQFFLVMEFMLVQ